MRRTPFGRLTPALATATIAGVVLTGCGGGGEQTAAPESSTPDGPTLAASRALTDADLPDGWTAATVPAEQAMLAALQSVQTVRDAQITPPVCKDRNVAAQEEVASTVVNGVQQNVTVAGEVRYGITLLPGVADPTIFEAAGTGECAQTQFGTISQSTERSELPGDTGATGFVFQTVRPINNVQTISRTAYFNKGNVTAMVSANPSVDGTVDQAGFDDLVLRVAGKL